MQCPPVDLTTGLLRTMLAYASCMSEQTYQSSRSTYLTGVSDHVLQSQEVEMVTIVVFARPHGIGNQ